MDALSSNDPTTCTFQALVGSGYRMSGKGGQLYNPQDSDSSSDSDDNEGRSSLVKADKEPWNLKDDQGLKQITAKERQQQMLLGPKEEDKVAKNRRKKSKSASVATADSY